MLPAPNPLEPVAKQISTTEGFRFVHRIAGGTFKETFLVEDAGGSSLALKVFRPGSAPERTDREFDAMRRCSHPNIAKLIAIDKIDVGGITYLYAIEPFLSGGSLADRLKSGLLTRPECFALGDALIDAVDHIASLDLVHRDLKPENICFSASGTPQIIDFGIVRNLSDTSLTSSWQAQGPGTPFYAAPEQHNNEKALIDWRSDQFSLGIVMAIASLGAHPYDHGNGSAEIVRAIASRKGLAPQFIGDASAAGLEILVRMTQAWPVARFRKPSLLAEAWRKSQKP